MAKCAVFESGNFARPDAGLSGPRASYPCGIARHDDGRRSCRSGPSDPVPTRSEASTRTAWPRQPPAGEPDRARRLKRGGTPSMRRSRQRRNRIDGQPATVSARSVRDRLGREDEEAPRPECERSFAEVAHARQAEVGLAKLDLKSIRRAGRCGVGAGTVDGWFELHASSPDSHEGALQPAIDYAAMAPGDRGLAEAGPAMRNCEGVSELCGNLLPNGARRQGRGVPHPLLANTLTAIAEGGATLSTRVTRARIEKYLRTNGGYLTPPPGSHASEWVEPASTNYRGYDVWELPPNTQGIAACRC